MSIRSNKKLFGFVPLTLLFFAMQSVTGSAFGQITEGSFRNFVTGVTPIIGENGAVVGGISIAPDGVVSRADQETSGKLSRVLSQAIGTVSRDASRSSPIRKISLRKLEQELARLRTAKLPLSAEIEFLAGLQRIEFVFVDTEHQDIILAGPAEGWRADDNGFVVGKKGGRPVSRKNIVQPNA